MAVHVSGHERAVRFSGHERVHFSGNERVYFNGHERESSPFQWS